MTTAGQMTALYRTSDINTASMHTRLNSMELHNKIQENRVSELESEVDTEKFIY